MYIDDLDLSNRTKNLLKRVGIFETSELLLVSTEELSSFKGFGNHAIDEVTAALKKLKPENYNSETNVKTTRSINSIDSVLRTIRNIPKSAVVTNVEFRERDNAQWVGDLPITSLNRALSASVVESLFKNGIKTAVDLAAAPIDSIRKLPKIGHGAINRLSFYIKNHVKYELVLETSRVKDVVDTINKEINDYSSTFRDLSWMVEAELTSNPELLQDEEIANNIWKSPNISVYVYSCIQHCVFLSNKWLTRSDIIAMLPTIISRNIDLDSLFVALSRSADIESLNEMYRGNKMTLEEWIDSLDTEIRGFVRMKLEDYSFSDIALKFNRSKEHVRQCIIKTMNRCPTLREDDCSYWYTRYYIPKEGFIKVWGISETVFNYYRIKYAPGILSIEEIFEDPYLTSEIATRISKYILDNKIIIGDMHMDRDKKVILFSLGEKYCRESSIAIDELFQYYNECLDGSKVSSDDELRFISLRSFRSYISSCSFLYFFKPNRVVFYDQTTKHYLSMLSELRLEKYYDVEISTLIIFQNQRKLMKKYKIKDEYELHSIIKQYVEYLNRYYTENSEFKISIGPAPRIMFGAPNRDEQVKRLLLPLAPITRAKFCKEYEKEYGIESRIVRKFYLDSIKEYYKDGVYTLTDFGLSQTEIQYLKRTLRRNFYFIDDVKHRFANKFGEGSLYKINEQTLAGFGYTSYSTYIIKKKNYSTAHDYFLSRFSCHTLYISHDGYNKPSVTVDLTKDKDILDSISVARSALNELTSQLELVELEEYKYIDRRNLENYISVDTLSVFLDSIPTYASEIFFTVKTLIRNGITNPFRSIGYKELPMQLLIKNSKRYGFFKIDDVYVYYEKKNQLSLHDFIEYNVLSSGENNADVLISKALDVYGVKLSIGMIKNASKDSGFGFDENTGALIMVP